jgi:hypothetical protein
MVLQIAPLWTTNCGSHSSQRLQPFTTAGYKCRYELCFIVI